VVEDPTAALLRLVNGYQISQCIYVVAVLGIAELLKDEPRRADELAVETDAHAPSLYRVLRNLAAAGVFHEDEEMRFSLTPMSERLRSDVSGSVAPWAAFACRPYRWEVWGNLLHTVRTGQKAFEHVHGMDPWRYRREHPEESIIFDRAMTSNSQQVAQAVVEAYDFSRISCVVDVGGGQGALLAAILIRNPSLRGVLFDQPHVVAGSEEVLRAAAVLDRCRIEGGSFFETVPEGCDAYVLKWIIHDWEDSAAVAILQGCRRAMAEDGRLLLVERVIGGPNEDLAAKQMDINMMMGPGGQERTREEFDALLARAGFRLIDVHPTAAQVSVIEAVPAE
jgi:hypothetical protein